MLSKFFEILVLLLSILLYNGKEEIWRTADKLGNLYESEAQTDRRYIGSQLQHDGKWWYYYDNEGNLILKSPYQRHGKSPDTSWQSGSWAYEWNANGSLKSVKRADGKEAAKQAALGFLKSAPRSVMHNLSQGISGDWVMKGIDASQQWLTAYGESGEGSLEDFAGYLRDSSFSEVNALKNIATGQGGTADWLAAGMLLIPGSTPNKSNKPNHAMGIVDEVSPKTSNHAKDIPDDLPNKPRPQTSKKPKVKKKPDGGAFEDVQLSTKGQLITLTNVTNIEFTYIKRNQADTIALRNKFNSSERKNFLKFLAKDKELLKAKGFSDADIRAIENGYVPDNYQVHHKYPLDDSGTNDFDNLVLIKNAPYHKAITAYQNAVTNGMSPGDSRIIDWYIMNGNIYP